MLVLEIPLNFLLPSLVRVLFEASRTEHQVGDDVGLDIRDLKILSDSKRVALQVYST